MSFTTSGSSGIRIAYDGLCSCCQLDQCNVNDRGGFSPLTKEPIARYTECGPMGNCGNCSESKVLTAACLVV